MIRVEERAVQDCRMEKKLHACGTQMCRHSETMTFEHVKLMRLTELEYSFLVSCCFLDYFVVLFVCCVSCQHSPYCLNVSYLFVCQYSIHLSCQLFTFVCYYMHSPSCQLFVCCERWIVRPTGSETQPAARDYKSIYIYIYTDYTYIIHTYT